MKIVIEKIPLKEQRYPTLGDYWIDKEGVMQVRITAPNDKSFFLILMHELAEAFLTKFRKISWKSIDKFDTNHPELDDPGLSKEAPYHKEHMVGDKIERLLCTELGMNWEEYNDSL